ncbi:hypothetical protein DM01DRAFT_180239 [Hesseltinella vesiculosa]|uniref:Transmembrane protein n=1 Tax=Hesseltinella vesiculosa TaxID=101127 RepID=A0A1X2GDW3_9FUNG|nr:hypothetical protein DM01DRAFT_180239 [Hesseltinella vesiculosa]
MILQDAPLLPFTHPVETQATFNNKSQVNVAMLGTRSTHPPKALVVYPGVITHHEPALPVPGDVMTTNALFLWLFAVCIVALLPCITLRTISLLAPLASGLRCFIAAVRTCLLYFSTAFVQVLLRSISLLASLASGLSCLVAAVWTYSSLLLYFLVVFALVFCSVILQQAIEGIVLLVVALSPVVQVLSRLACSLLARFIRWLIPLIVLALKKLIQFGLFVAPLARNFLLNLFDLAALLVDAVDECLLYEAKQPSENPMTWPMSIPMTETWESCLPTRTSSTLPPICPNQRATLGHLVLAQPCLIVPLTAKSTRFVQSVPMAVL